MVSRIGFIDPTISSQSAFSGNLTWRAHESRNLLPYAKSMKAIPMARVGGCKLQILSKADWGNDSLHQRLQKERRRLKVMAWPLDTDFRYPNLPDVSEDVEGPIFVRLNEITHEDEVAHEIEEALAEARRQKVTILIFPELAITSALERVIRERLAAHGADSHPILTLMGLSHRPSNRPNLDLNEAILLGPDGTEWHRHSKMTNFTFNETLAEQVEVGGMATILETQLGNLMPLICLDFLNSNVEDRLVSSHANVLLVPSLSPQTRAHQDAAKRFQLKLLASSFVCNRCLEEQPSQQRPKGSSFFRIPRRKNPLVLHYDGGAEHPQRYLCFELE